MFYLYLKTHQDRSIPEWERTEYILTDTDHSETTTKWFRLIREYDIGIPEATYPPNRPTIQEPRRSQYGPGSQCVLTSTPLPCSYGWVFIADKADGSLRRFEPLDILKDYHVDYEREVYFEVYLVNHLFKAVRYYRRQTTENEFGFVETHTNYITCNQCSLLRTNEAFYHCRDCDMPFCTDCSYRNGGRLCILCREELDAGTETVRADDSDIDSDDSSEVLDHQE